VRTETYAFSIPLTPPSLNEYTRWHWTHRKREKDAFQTLVWGYLNERGNRCPRGFDEVEIRAVLMFTEERRRDSDNFGAVLAKWVQDSLVRERVIPDDTADRCTCHPPKIVLGRKPMTVITLELRRREAA
jgi:hypothetical protein